MRRVISLIAVVALAGCVAPGDNDLPVQAVLDDYPVPKNIQFLCDHASYTPADACATALGIDEDRWAEPYVAAHPVDEGTFVVAVQGGRDPVATYPGVGPTQPYDLIPDPCPWHQICIFATVDAGASWSLRSVGEEDLNADPVMAFVGDTLYIAGLVDGGGLKIYATTDLGISWDSGVAISSVDSTDRPWIGVGDGMMMVWQTMGQKQGWWSYSSDGRVWSEPGELPCNLLTQPHFLEHWLVACGDANGATPVYQIEPGVGADVVATLPPGSGTRMMAGGVDDALWVSELGPLRMFRGSTSGTTWSNGVELGMPGWDKGWAYAIEEVPWGGVVALVAGGQTSCIYNCTEGRALPTELVVLGDQLVGRHTLAPAGEPQDRPVASNPKIGFGEYGGIACQQDLCLAAWMEGSGVDVAWFGPEP